MCFSVVSVCVLIVIVSRFPAFQHTTTQYEVQTRLSSHTENDRRRSGDNLETQSLETGEHVLDVDPQYLSTATHVHVQTVSLSLPLHRMSSTNGLSPTPCATCLCIVIFVCVSVCSCFCFCFCFCFCSCSCIVRFSHVVCRMLYSQFASQLAKRTQYTVQRLPAAYILHCIVHCIFCAFVHCIYRVVTSRFRVQKSSLQPWGVRYEGVNVQALSMDLLSSIHVQATAPYGIQSNTSYTVLHLHRPLSKKVFLIDLFYLCVVT